ncbi:hypothetical protein [Horticoccus sp. 23ND18S-11]|uniref:hypothetical protein n=1 Tax=Horticoccus sp. 23ND18S-11 TaxID=3391832 RepID=UPI0039C9396E
MRCRLCQRDGTIRNSHIIPEFFYGPMYDEKHRFFTVSSNPVKKDLTFQKGMREYLLCDVCEGSFGKNEKYFSELFFGGVSAEYADDGRHIHIKGIDYPKTKLMFMSILWRMSVSSLPFFDSVDLGPHEEKFRTMLLAENPGSAESYGVMAVAPYFEGKHLGHFITKPDIARITANRVYRCVMGGVLFLFYVPGRKIPPAILPFMPSPAGTWRVRKEKIEDIKFLFHYTLELGKGIHAREG